MEGERVVVIKCPSMESDSFHGLAAVKYAEREVVKVNYGYLLQ